MKKKLVHIIGIVGQLSAPLAVALKKEGWKVTGSDQEKTYPPLTDHLIENKISWSSGYKKENIKTDIDLIIIAGSALRSDPNNPEVKMAKQMGLKIISQARAIERFVIKKNSTVVSGTFGKTTTTGMIVSIFKESVENPSYMIGGVPVNKSSPLQIEDSDWSIVEGDEYPTLGYDPNSKFLYYHPKFLVLTSARWEHQDVFKKETDYIDTYKKVINKIPQNGFVLASEKGENIKKVLNNFTGKIYYYGVEKGDKTDFWAEKIKYTDKGARFYLYGKNIKKPVKIEVCTYGQHNIENAVAASSLAILNKIPEKYIQQGIFNFKGIKKRLELVGKYNGVSIISDISQTKPRIMAALRAARTHFKANLWVVFYPHYSGLQEKESLVDYQNTFDKAKKVIVSKVIFRSDVDKKDRVSGSEIVAAINKSKKSSSYIPIDEKIVNILSKQTKPGDAIIFTSSGSYREILKNTINRLKRRKND